jgi:hypothetical protein
MLDTNASNMRTTLPTPYDTHPAAHDNAPTGS